MPCYRLFYCYVSVKNGSEMNAATLYSKAMISMIYEGGASLHCRNGLRVY